MGTIEAPQENGFDETGQISENKPVPAQWLTAFGTGRFGWPGYVGLSRLASAALLKIS